MNEKDKPEKEDLSDFADYLAEFESLINFDDETCPVCGVNISSTISIQNSPFVEYIKVKSEDDLLTIIKQLELSCVPYKIEKQLDSTSTSEIIYIYTILVPINCLDKLKKEKV